MNSRFAPATCAALAIILGSGCATPDSQTTDSAAHSTPGSPDTATLGPDGEPMADTPTGADATLAGAGAPGDAHHDNGTHDDGTHGDPAAPGTSAQPSAPDAPSIASAAAIEGDTQDPIDSIGAPDAANAAHAPNAANAPGAPRTRPAPGTPVGTPTRDGQMHQYELRAYGTDIEVYMDGARVPADRIHMAEQSVGVLDANGAVIERIDLPEHWAQDAQRATTPNPADPYDFRDVRGTKLVPPKVMLGGRLVEPSPALLMHLGDRGVQRDRVSVVTNVIPGLPLAVAGVQNHDIVVAVNEVPDADPESVRAVIRTMKPGETITLRVLRGVETLDFQVAAAAWDPKHMVRHLGAGGQTPTEASTAPGATPPVKAPTVDELQVDLAAARAEIAALEKRIREGDPVRKSIRPQATPAPKAGGGGGRGRSSGNSGSGGSSGNRTP